MSNVQFKLKQLKDQLTETEEKIAKVIETKPKLILKASSQELADLSGTSPASWNRLAKKLGYKGVVELKVELATEGNKPEIYEDIDLLINGSEMMEDLVLKYQRICEKSLADTIKILDVESLKQAIKLMIKADRIFIYGVGASSTIAFDFLQKVSRIGKTAIFYPDMHLLLSHLSSITSRDVLLSISYSGETPEVIFGSNLAKENGANVISISGFNPTNSLAKISDVKLFIPLEEKKLRVGAITSRNSSLLLTDILYLGLAAEDYEATLSMLKYSHTKADILKNGRK
ncbi:MurR/RpiR family transcriptional regulator [Facklamia miroungae]|uniref:DNA-binding transcriptional regulator, MurR/RpiR family, contains HTH and SIS domains n=1 Tax=Facklamia miroungae TaxID=120956 RepID=A0A1G7RWB5_9LACT|nr:MurR/RpiR family transcriptional regulator [Facklamia miroungae]NKZ29250.1 MurR/RpiR family transcriptional regulator [Facklamia miroungae]SDG15065.1 DNA-binding transcriptional regulator, MurR/RpiR family, contains HTH and SIS domains [Facklamia miroungae]